MKRDTVVQTAAGVVTMLSLLLSGGVAAALTNSAGRNQLTYGDTAEEGDPPEVAIGIAMGAFRGVFVNVLWFRANELKEAGQYYEAMELSRAITKLQPRFPQVWVFHAWNMAYNISVATQTYQERWQWVQSGVRLLRNEGIPANPNDMLLHKELAWIFLHKIAGITDDSNQFYKKKIAEEWTIVLGAPPARRGGERSYEAAIDRHVEWLRPISDAPASRQQLAESDPLAIELLDRVRAATGDQSDFQLLQRYAVHEALATSLRRAQAERSFRERSAAFAALLDDTRYADAWPVLISHLRRRVLEDEYNMEPSRMIRFTRKFGPIDWRHPAAHALYWSHRGVEESLTRWTEENKRDFDFINTDRIAIQSLQELYRSGEIYFNFFEFITGGDSHYLAVVNPYFVDSYGNVLEEMMERSWADVDKRPYRLYAAGYENFLKDAIRYFYRRGDHAKAEQLYTELGTFPGQNRNNPYREAELSVPLNEFVFSELQEDRVRTGYVFVSEVVGALEGAYVGGLLAGDMEKFRQGFDWARQIHKYYFEMQVMKTRATEAGETRVGVLDDDFAFVAGDLFAKFVQNFTLDEAADVFGRAPIPLQVYAYDTLRAAWQPALDAEADSGAPGFDELFPEPPGMEAHRIFIERKIESLREQRLDIDAQ